MFTKENKIKIAKLLQTEYNQEQLKDFITRCTSERAFIIISTKFDSNEPIEIERRKMLKTLQELQEIAQDRLAYLIMYGGESNEKTF